MATMLLSLRFVLELCLLGSMVAIGLSASDNGAVAILLAGALLATVAGLWGVLLSPGRRIDLPLPLRVVIEVALFAAAGVGLAASGRPTAGVVIVAAELVLLPALAALGHPPGQRPQRVG